MSAPWLYLLSMGTLGVTSFALFRVRTRREYMEKGKLSPLSSLLELIVWLAYAAIPYIYNPPCWPYVWSCRPWAPAAVAGIGYGLTAFGALIGFGSMAWLGVRRSFGRRVGDLLASGPYSFSRNPQIVGGTLMITGVAWLWPSWYALGWAVLWPVMFHPMVLTEEEHMQRIFGEGYRRYSEQVARYIGRGRASPR